MDESREPEPVPLEFTDTLDLHSFLPDQIGDLVRDFLEAAAARGLSRLRIIHGRGTGTQRRRVRALVERDPRVVTFADAPAEAGGWGATVVTLETGSKSPNTP